jgi:hypothetical protein
MLTADVWQDEYTTGARPPLEHYQVYDRDFGLYDGPIDGWFAIYRKRTVRECSGIQPARYYCLGCAVRQHLHSIGQHGLLCTRMKVFHVTGPFYTSYFGMLDSEIAKYQSIGRLDMVNWYCADRRNVPPAHELAERVRRIREHLAHGVPATVTGN